jgi:hypothetical protein
MTTEPPPLPEHETVTQASAKGCTVLLIIVGIGVALLIGLLAFGVYYYFANIRVGQARARQESIMQKSGQMHPNFLELLTAIHSVLDEPDEQGEIGTVDSRGSQPHIDEAKRLLEARKFQELNRYLSTCYSDKLMTKEGFFIYRLVIDRLSKEKGTNDWVDGAGGSHAHIAAGLAEIDLAWEARGSGYARTVSAKGWEGFKSHLGKAAGHYKKATETDEHNSVALGLLMTIGLGTGQLENMIPQVIDSGVGHTPEDGELAAKIAYYYTPRWHGSQEQVITFVRDELKKWPDSGGKFDCLVSRLDLATEWGNPKFLSTSPATRKVYRKIVEKYGERWPQGSYAAGRIAQLYIRRECYDEAIAFCREYEGAFRDKSGFHSQVGRALFLKGQYAEAKGHLLQASDLGADDGLNYYYLARAATRARDLETGEMAARKAVELLPSSEQWKRGRSYALLAKCVFQRSDLEGALKYASKAVEIDPSQEYSWYLRGFAHYRLHQREEAKSDFLKAIELDPSFAAKIDVDCPGWREW